jgi:hypothetical protein
MDVPDVPGHTHFDPAVADALAAVAQVHGAVVAGYIGAVRYMTTDGDRLHNGIALIGSDMDTVEAAGLVRILERWADTQVDEALFEGDED